jgi:hypothetical protein
LFYTAAAAAACSAMHSLCTSIPLQFHRNPFHFKHVQVLKGGAAIDDCGPCVVMATPSMLQSGLSRDLFEAWCESSQNTVIIADFAVQGTLARDILSSPTHVMSRQGVKVCKASYCFLVLSAECTMLWVVAPYWHLILFFLLDGRDGRRSLIADCLHSS